MSKYVELNWVKGYLNWNNNKRMQYFLYRKLLITVLLDRKEIDSYIRNDITYATWKVENGTIRLGSNYLQPINYAASGTSSISFEEIIEVEGSVPDWKEITKKMNKVWEKHKKQITDSPTIYLEDNSKYVEGLYDRRKAKEDNIVWKTKDRTNISTINHVSYTDGTRDIIDLFSQDHEKPINMVIINRLMTVKNSGNGSKVDYSFKYDSKMKNLIKSNTNLEQFKAIDARLSELTAQNVEFFIVSTIGFYGFNLGVYIKHLSIQYVNWKLEILDDYVIWNPLSDKFKYLRFGLKGAKLSFYHREQINNTNWVITEGVFDALPRTNKDTSLFFISGQMNKNINKLVYWVSSSWKQPFKGKVITYLPDNDGTLQNNIEKVDENYLWSVNYPLLETIKRAKVKDYWDLYMIWIKNR